MSNASHSDAPTRRDFLALLTSAASVAVVPTSLRSLIRMQQVEPAFRWESVTPAARVAYGSGGNSLAVIRGGDELLVDTKVTNTSDPM